MYDTNDRAGKLLDALIESPTADDPDEIWGDPTNWPEWTDTDVWAIDPDDENFVRVVPPDWPITDAETIEELRRVERLEPFEPSPEDLDLLLDLEERRRYEAGCNARFV